ncbi:hypothetical protein GLOIN_2v1481003 [Rhizophagus clarus]|uniref:Uncharacterized protein n=1 Tax=Rhizophagus clarus TaxID=94130 RepID=A0A8H3M3F1_9GLOM|nr:hypothetical protein GLOIN_2v1481003 [Rhizophagus clarus]
MVRKDKKNRICECCGKTLAIPQKLRQHYSSTKNQCSLPSENNNNQRRVNTPKVTRHIRPKSPRPRSPSPVPTPAITDPEPTLSSNNQKDSEAGPGPTTQANRKKQRKIVNPITAVDIHFEECPVVPHPEENPAYAFNVPVFGHEYAEAPYIPQLISASRPKIKEVLQTELHRKDQIKSAIVVKCLYLLDKKDKEDFANKVYKVKYHRGEMRAILLEGNIDEHITLTVGEIDKQVEEALLKGSGYTLERIEEISIEAYNLKRGTGGSFIPTPKKLANTNFPSEKSLDHHIEWCPGIHENASQRVTMPVKGVNDFEEFKNYGRMINAPCVIIADFKADNKKCDEKYEEIERLESKIVGLNKKVEKFDKKLFKTYLNAEHNGIQTTIEKATKAIASEKAKADKD